MRSFAPKKNNHQYGNLGLRRNILRSRVLEYGRRFYSVSDTDTNYPLLGILSLLNQISLL